MDAFVKAATSGRRARADALYDQADDPWARLVKGDGWEGDPSAPGGPNGWAPLLYVTHSVYASVALARELLARGADPNVTFTSEHGEMSALYGAAGVVHDPELTKLLLEAGANPVDGESIYHATEAADPACLRALIEHGAMLEPIHLAHALDDERLEHVQLLLDAGEVAGKLRDLGAATEVDADDLDVAAIARGEHARGPEQPDFDQQEVLILAALHGHAARVIEAYGPDFEGVVAGSPKASLVHHAAWFGVPAVIDELLAAGADPDAALATAVHASGDPRRDHVGVAERLVAYAAISAAMAESSRSAAARYAT